MDQNTENNEEELRQLEVDKYSICYDEDPGYRMGRLRMIEAKKALAELPYRGSYLDVGCGRGEMVAYAKDGLKFEFVRGTETVDSLLSDIIVKATVDNLPFHDGQFEVVSMFDVIEHLNEFDLEVACKELDRVSSNVIIVTASNVPSTERGMDLHITKKPYAEWDKFFNEVFSGKAVWRHDLTCRINETWIVEK